MTQERYIVTGTDQHGNTVTEIIEPEDIANALALFGPLRAALSGGQYTDEPPEDFSDYTKF